MLTTVFAASLLTGITSTVLTIGLIVLMASSGYPDQTMGMGNSIVLAPLLAAVAGGVLEVVMRRRSTRAGSSRAGGA